MPVVRRDVVANAVVGTVVGSAVSGLGGAVMNPVVRSLKSIGRDLGLLKKPRRRRRSSTRRRRRR